MHKNSLALLFCFSLAACAGSADKANESASADSNWWSFGSAQKSKPKAEAKAVPKVDHQLTDAWLDEYEPRLREALKGSKMQLERQQNVLVVTAPVDSSFNPDRPSMLMPAVLGPFTRVAKILEKDPRTAVLILGHADSKGQVEDNRKLSEDRAKAVASIFRLSGLQRDRLLLKGVGSNMPRAANDSNEGRALNRRVEIVLTPQKTLVALLAKYNQPAAPSKTVADQGPKVAVE
ncbi:OmpA family protein [Pseudomonas sp. J452]|nr:OmpA family protein [Pseudomonas sp. J452]UUY07915.1 OmpA family protein [Pseudomonas sp. J452]